MDDCPEGHVPSGWVEADLSRDRPPRGSQRSFEPGRSLHPLSGPLQPGVRFLRDPLPATDAPDLTTRLVAPVRRDSATGFPCSVRRARVRRTPTFLPVIVLSACPHQAGRHPITYRFGQSLSVDLALSMLDGIYQWFTYVGPLTQPSASSGFRLPESRDDPHGHHVPVEGGYVVSALGTRSLPTPHCT